MAANQLAPTLDGLASGRTPVDESRVSLQTNRVGRFALIRELGSGGMGAVFAAYDEQLDRKVALKILRRAQAGNETQRLLTLREARAAARISHPNVIAVYEVGESAGLIHIAMEYVEGTTLLAWQTETRRDWRELLAMYLQVGEGLLAAHDADVVHRDFKPDNVLIGQDGRPRVVDFGLARVGWVDPQSEAEADAAPQPIEGDAEARSSGRLTLPGIISGTPGYMSPEQYRGGDVDSRSDQWSFCAALFEALYGHLPFSGKTLFEHAEVVHGAPRPPPAGTKVPDEVYRALCRGLSPDPAQRFPSMAELLAALAQEQRGDIASGALSRQRFARVFIAIPVFVMLLIQIRRSPQLATPREAILASLFALVIVLSGGLWQRRVLIGNRFHRDIWIILLIGGTQNLFIRIFAALQDLPLPTVYPFEMMVMAGAAAILTALHLRSFRFLPLLPLAAAILSVTANLPRRVFALVYPIIVILLVIAWSRGARSVKQQESEKGASSGAMARVRRTTSRRSDRSTAESGPTSTGRHTAR